MLLALGLGTAALAACGDSEESTETASPSAQPPSSTSTTPPRPVYDVSHVDSIKDDFPAGFTTDAHPAKALAQQDIDNSGIIPFTQAQFDPPQCRALVIPPYTEPTVDTQAAGVRGTGDQGEIHVVALRLPKPVPVTPPPAGCDQVSMSGAPEASGSAQPIPAPQIEGVTTTGAQLNPADEEEDPDYMFTAALDDQTSVIVMGSTQAELNPQQVMSDLLVKATAAVRGSG